MSKKAVFFDVDGTLIDYTGGMDKILDSTKKAINRIKAQGHLAILATGRPKSFLDDEILALDFDGFITSNGSYIEVNNKTIYNRQVDKKVLKEAVDFFRKHKIEFVFEGQELSYFSSLEAPALKRLLQVFSIPKKNVTDSWKVEEVSSNKLVIAQESEEQLTKCKEFLGGEFTFMNHPKETTYDVYFKDCTKADGIKRLIEHINIPIENTYAFGDGLNDIEMLQVVKYGIAMGNANERLKRVANLVTNDVFSNGIYNALKKLEVI
jgi:Cof subfamily protein (haloacid dehalogenase superfamily)